MARVSTQLGFLALDISNESRRSVKRDHPGVPAFSVPGVTHIADRRGHFRPSHTTDFHTRVTMAAVDLGRVAGENGADGIGLS
jgi:hypothetical protein